MKIELTVGFSRSQQQIIAADFVSKLPSDKAFIVTIKPYARDRSLEQNRYLWGVVYQTIIDSFDFEDPEKPTKENLHEYWLGECFGWDMQDTLGRVVVRSMKRSSKLTTKEFNDFYQFIQRRCSETRGLYIPDPNEALKHEITEDKKPSKRARLSDKASQLSG